MQAIEIAVLAVLGGLPADAQVSLHGTGNTFASPMMVLWVNAYEKATGERIEYENVEPGRSLLDRPGKLVDFTVSDVSPHSVALADVRSSYPLVLGGIVPVANIDGVAAGQLRLSGSVLADMYLGRIRSWNDDAIRNLNPTLTLPNANITVVYRSGASGGTLLWTQYLANESTHWQAQVGVSAQPNWPRGVGSDDNPGVASLVQRTRFSIGYADYYFVRRYRLRDVALETRSGRSVRATHESILSSVTAPRAAGWPMVTLSAIQIAPSKENSDRRRATLRFVCWLKIQGALLAHDRYFVTLPEHNPAQCREK